MSNILIVAGADNGHGSAKASFRNKKQSKFGLYKSVRNYLQKNAVACAETRFTTQSRNTKKVVTKTILNCFYLNHFSKRNFKKYIHV